MDLKELDYIVTVANEGSISRAAEKLFMAQSILSQAVRLFEQDLGGVLTRERRFSSEQPAESVQPLPGRRLFSMPDRFYSNTRRRAVRLRILKI